MPSLLHFILSLLLLIQCKVSLNKQIAPGKKFHPYSTW